LFFLTAQSTSRLVKSNQVLPYPFILVFDGEQMQSGHTRPEAARRHFFISFFGAAW
jgi:hypothetical protein